VYVEQWFNLRNVNGSSYPKLNFQLQRKFMSKQ